MILSEVGWYEITASIRDWRDSRHLFTWLRREKKIGGDTESFWGRKGINLKFVKILINYGINEDG